MMQETATKPYVLVEYEGAYAELLRFAFNQICDKDDWRAPIDCMVPPEAMALYKSAIAYMTATVATCDFAKKDGREWARLTSVGYRNGPAGC